MAEYDDTPDGPSNVSAKVRTALARFKTARDASANQRQRELVNLQFQVPELQWDPAVREERRGQIINGVPIPARPVVSVPKIAQPIKLVANQERAAHLGVQISALSGGASGKTADIIQDIYRGIERDSRAGLVRSWGFTRTLWAGWGVYRILTEYDDTSDHPLDQKILLKRIVNAGNVFLDPFAEEPDWSDGRWAFIVHRVPWDRYKQDYPKSKMANFDDTTFDALLTEAPGWVDGDKASRTVQLAEYFYIEYADEKYYDTDAGVVAEKDLPEGFDAKSGQVAREKRVPTVHWCTINAVEELGESTTLPGPYIPIVVQVGDELQPFDGERRWEGIAGPAKNSQQIFNYAAAKTVEDIAAQPVSPWVMAEGQDEGHEAEWDQANVRRFSRLRYKPTTLNGMLVGPPTRSSASTDLSSNLALLQSADEWIQSATFTPDPSLGNLNSRDRSGKAIQALQQQSDIGNSNYIGNQKDISVFHESRIVLSWIPFYYDRPGRIVRTVQKDDSEAPIMINQPYIVNPDTDELMAVDPQMLPQGVTPQQVKHYDLKKGIYGVAVTVGKSFATGRKEGANALGELFAAIPQTFPPLGPLWARFSDWPGHDEAADILKKMQPPQLQDAEEDGQPSREQLQQQLQQGGQAFKQLQQQAGQMKQALDTDQAKQAASVEIAKMKAQTEREMKQMELGHAERLEKMKLQYSLEETRQKAQAQVAVEQIKAGFAGARAAFDAEIADDQRAANAQQESAEAGAGRMHERDMASEARDAQMQESDANRQFEAEQADASRLAEADAAAQEPLGGA